MKKTALGIFIGLTILALSGTVVLGQASGRNNKIQTPEIETIVFIDYKSPTHAGPGQHPTVCSGNFKFTNGGLKWSIPSVVDYDLDSTGSGLAASDVSTDIANSFAAWKSAEPDSPTFSEGAGTNTISWESLGTGGIVAFASISYFPATKEIVAFNIVFNDDLDWSTSGEPGEFDVQNVATHEAGHVEGLGHVNAPKDGWETMYKLTDEAETIKQDLCTGDIAGIDSLY